MARQNIVPNPAQKLFEAYMDFSGGLNSEIANDRLKDNEFPIFENADLSGRASAKRRYGRDLIAYITQNTQGMFWFYRSGQPTPDLFIAAGGQLYVLHWANPSVWNDIANHTWEDFANVTWDTLQNASFVNVPCKDLAGGVFTFQTTLPVEGVQYMTSLFVATGTKLVEVTWDSTNSVYTANQVTAYKPSTLEATNVGLNALADTPSSWIQDTTAGAVSITTIIPSLKVGLINTPIDFTAHVQKPVNVNVDVAFTFRPAGAGSYQSLGSTIQNFTCEASFQNSGEYDIQATASATTTSLNECDNTTGWVNTGTDYLLAGNNLDGVDGIAPALVFTSTSGGLPPNQATAVNSEVAYYNFPTAIDMSGCDTLTWWWTKYSQSTQSGMNDNVVQLHFYTAGNLTTPILTVGNKGGTGRGMGGGWQKETSTFNGALTGMNQIVRMGVQGLNGGAYIPNTGYQPSSNDSSDRLDQIRMFHSGVSASYILQNYSVGGVNDPLTDPATYQHMQTCRMVRLDESTGCLILGKDSVYPGQIYVSQPNNPRYFATNGRIDFSDGTNEPVTSFVRFQNYYMAFTKTSISVVEGIGTSSYSVKKVHSEIGCVADRSAKVVNNDLYFLSAEGIYKITPHPYRIDIMNVTRIDWQMKSEITPDTDACAITYDNQYWIAFPSKKVVYRCYYDNSGVWVKDTGTKLNITQFLQYGNTMYQLSSDGSLYLANKNRFDDVGEAFTMSLESKYFDLDASFNYKKLKRVYFLAHSYREHDVNYGVTIIADGQVVLSPTVTTFPIVNGVVQQVDTTTPNLNFYGGTNFGTWLLSYSPFGDVNVQAKVMHVHGKARRVKIKFTHSDPVACELLGFGLEFKMKKPY